MSPNLSDYPLGGERYLADAFFQPLMPYIQTLVDKLGFVDEAGLPVRLVFVPDVEAAKAQKAKDKIAPPEKEKPLAAGPWLLSLFRPEWFSREDGDLSDQKPKEGEVPAAKLPDGVYGLCGCGLSRPDVHAVISFSRKADRDFWNLHAYVPEGSFDAGPQTEAWQALLELLLAAPRTGRPV